ncbi:MAG: RNA polymerase sigma factor [Phycisphaerales bacterium]|nr:RNA polymerase sigma factor [Phycisphaerales bacterium]
MTAPQPHSPSTCASLLSRLRLEGDDAAWVEFRARYHDLLFRFCRKRGLQHADAEDVVQNVFASLAQSIRNFVYDPQRGRFRDYLYRCVRNAIGEWRRRTTQKGLPLDTVSEAALETAPEHDTDLWQAEWTAHHYRLAFESIRSEFDGRNIELFERNIAGESVESLAQQSGVTAQSIYSSRRRIRERLRELIARQVREEDEPDEVSTESSEP